MLPAMRDAMPRPEYPAVCIFADTDGESHLLDLVLPILHKEVAADGKAHWTGLSGALSFGIAGASSGGAYDKWHCSTGPGLAIVLEGAWEIEASTGERRLLDTGSVLVMLDDHGRGHFAHPVRQPCSTLGITLDEETGLSLRAQAEAALAARLEKTDG